MSERLRTDTHSRIAGHGTPPRERGMVLVIVLILLAVISMLAVTTLTVTGMEEKMAANEQEFGRVFQAAESGISSAMKLKNILDSTATEASPTTNTFNYRGGNDTAVTTTWYQAMGREAPPGYSMGGPFRAHYFTMRSAATTTGGAIASHRQGYYVIGPGT